MSKPTGSAPPSKMPDRARKTSGKARNLKQNGNIFPTTRRNVRERKEKHLDQKLQVQKEKPTYIHAFSEGMAEDAKVDDGARSRLRRALKQLRKDREEERAARELLEGMQQHVDEAQERACESERSLCRELAEYMYSWERENGIPHDFCTKNWQMMQSNNTKSDKLESDFTEILERMHQLVWKETAKTIRVWAEKEEDESPLSWSGSCSLPELSDLVVWSGGFEVKPADGKCGGNGGWMDLLGGDDQATVAIYAGLRCSTGMPGQRNHGIARGPDSERNERRMG